MSHPEKLKLYIVMCSIRQLCKLSGVKVFFCHITQEKSVVADWLLNVAWVLKQDCWFHLLDLRVGDPPPWPTMTAPQRVA